MKRLGKYKLLLVFFINIIIAVAYFIDNKDASYSELSSDIQNIIPVAQKFDNPQLFAHDLYLDNLSNVKYYTPFYVQSLRFIAKFTNYNYVQAINVLGLFCHLAFGILWFFLLYKYSNSFWIALFVSILMRGIIWLPGLEIWGISDLWTIMPRTLYISILPLPFILLSNTFTRVLFAAFIIGLIFNFHPITGLGGILLFVSFLSLSQIYFKKQEWLSLTKSITILICILMGMLPFILTYFGKTTSEVTYSIAEFNAAFNTRIPEYFSQPLFFLKQWFHFKTLFFILPLGLFYVYAFTIKEELQKAKVLIILTFILVIIPTISVPIEQLVNNVLGLNLRLSFQLIRVQKVAIIPGFFALAFLLKNVIKSNRIIIKLFPYVVGLYFVLLSFSQSPWLKNVPFIGDDISNTILPHNLSFFSTVKDSQLDIDRMSNYIETNTEVSDLICGSHIYRGATKRSVVFDGKGASMLIEGNPEQFIKWHLRQQKISNLQSMQEVIDYLKLFHVDYFVTRNEGVPATLVHTEGPIFLYKL